MVFSCYAVLVPVYFKTELLRMQSNNTEKTNFLKAKKKPFIVPVHGEVIKISKAVPQGLREYRKRWKIIPKSLNAFHKYLTMEDPVKQSKATGAEGKYKSVSGPSITPVALFPAKKGISHN